MMCSPGFLLLPTGMDVQHSWDRSWGCGPQKGSGHLQLHFFFFCLCLWIDAKQFGMFKGYRWNLPNVAPLGAGWEGVNINYSYNSLVMIQLKSSALPAPFPSLLTTGLLLGWEILEEWLIFSAFYFQLAAASSRNGEPCRGVSATYICTAHKYWCFSSPSGVSCW